MTSALLQQIVRGLDGVTAHGSHYHTEDEMKQNFIAEAISEHWGDRCPDIDADCACCQAWAEYDRLSSSPAQPVAIKPLEWQTYAGGRTDFAETILGSWSVWDFDGENAHVRGPNDHAGRLVGGNIEAAKAAAQSDYEARIRSALIGGGA